MTSLIHFEATFLQVGGGVRGADTRAVPRIAAVEFTVGLAVDASAFTEERTGRRAGIVGSAAAAYDLAKGTYFDLMHAMSPEIRETHYILALEDVAAPPLAAMAVDLARGRGVMVVAPHGLGLASSIERAGVVVTVVAPAAGVAPCVLSELRDHHARVVAQGMDVGVVVGAWPTLRNRNLYVAREVRRAHRVWTAHAVWWWRAHSLVGRAGERE